VAFEANYRKPGLPPNKKSGPVRNRVFAYNPIKFEQWWSNNILRIELREGISTEIGDNGTGQKVRKIVRILPFLQKQEF
jgi:hypothetical protein